MNPRSAVINSWHHTSGASIYTLNTLLMCENANALNNLIVDLGLIRLSNAEFSGQSGVLVPTVALAGETQVVRPNTNTTGLVIATFAYKHPVLDLYFRLEVLFTRRQDSNNDHMHTRITVFFAIKDGTISGTSCSYDSFSSSYAVLFGTKESFKRGDGNLYGYCDDNGFWLATTPSVRTTPLGQNANAPIVNSSQLCILVQRDQTASKTLIMFGQICSAAGSQLASGSIIGADGVFGSNPNVYVYTQSKGMLFGPSTEISPFTVLPMPHIVTENGAIRVFASEIVDGDYQKYSFNFGTVNASAMADGAIGLIDLLSSGSPSEYMAIEGFGPITPAAPAGAHYRESAHLQLLLPWISP